MGNLSPQPSLLTSDLRSANVQPRGLSVMCVFFSLYCRRVILADIDRPCLYLLDLAT